MQKMPGYFEDFRKAIEPEKKRKKEAQKADDPVREHLKTHKSFSDRHVDTFLCGSYRRSTAVGDIKDVDIVVVTNSTTNDAPIDILNQLKDSLSELYNEPDLADQRRSIRVDHPIPEVPDSNLTLDIIPAIYQNTRSPGGLLWIPDRDKQCWIPSHPKGHITYSSGLNIDSYQERAFVRLTKMMKWWWKFQISEKRPWIPSHERKPKGFWIEVMTGEYADLSRDSYPELIVALFENAYNKFKPFRTNGRLPALPDPGLRNYSDPEYRNIKTSMAPEEFSFFLDTLEECLGYARAAWAASSEQQAATLWQQIFGDKFPVTLIESGHTSLLSPAVMPGGLSFPDRPIVPRKPGGFA